MYASFHALVHPSAAQWSRCDKPLMAIRQVQHQHKQCPGCASLTAFRQQQLLCPCMLACAALMQCSPEHSQRVVVGDVILPLAALPREDVNEDVVTVVAGHSICGRGVARHIVGPWVAIEAVQVIGYNVGVVVGLRPLWSVSLQCSKKQRWTLHGLTCAS